MKRTVVALIAENLAQFEEDFLKARSNNRKIGQDDWSQYANNS